MMVDKFDYSMSDASIAALLGERLEAKRLKANIPQAVVAAEVGISETTYRNLIKGKGKIETLVAVLRCLDALHELESWLQVPEFSPMQRLKLKGKPRLRASKQLSLDDEQSTIEDW